MTMVRFRQPTNPLEVLQAYFDKNPEQLNLCMASSKKVLATGFTNRVFDEFPLLITEFEFNNQVALFQIMAATLATHQLDPDEPRRTLDHWSRQQLGLAAIKIALQGCQGLIDQNKPHPKLVELLDWHEYENKIDISDLVSAYVGTTFGRIHYKLSENPQIDEPALHAISNYWNQHYRKWVIEAINNKSGCPYKDTNVPEPEQNKHETRNAIAKGVGIAAGVTLFTGCVALAAATGAGIGLFSANSPAPRRQDPERTRDPHLDPRFGRQLY